MNRIIDKFQIFKTLFFTMLYLIVLIIYYFTSRDTIPFNNAFKFAIVFGILEICSVLFIKKIIVFLIFYFLNSYIADFICLIILYVSESRIINFKILKTAFIEWLPAIYVSLPFSFLGILAVCIYSVIHKRKISR